LDAVDWAAAMFRRSLPRTNQDDFSGPASREPCVNPVRGTAPTRWDKPEFVARDDQKLIGQIPCGIAHKRLARGLNYIINYFPILSIPFPSLPIRRDRSWNDRGITIDGRWIFSWLWLVDALMVPPRDLQILFLSNNIHQQKAVR
jgi:hypothetical protein